MSAADAIEVDLSDVLRGFALMKARGADLSPVMRDVKEWLKPEIAEHFQEQEGPEGTWPAWAASTVERRSFARGSGYVRKRGKKREGRAGSRFKRRQLKWNRTPLGRFGQVRSYVFRMTSQSITMQARGAWAGIHQFGGIAGHGARIPARPFLWVGDELVERFGRAVMIHIVEGWEEPR